MKFLGMLAVTSAIMLITGCGEKPKPELALTECTNHGVEAPAWVCGAYNDEKMITGVGHADPSDAGLGFMITTAQEDGRSKILAEITSDGQRAYETYTGQTGIKDRQFIDVHKKEVVALISNFNLRGSKQLAYWENPEKGNIAILMGIPKANVEEKIQGAVRSSYDSPEAKYQIEMAEKEQAALLERAQ